MPLQKAQMHRLMRIAALLKENRYPNSETLVKEFRRIALEEELEISCVKKTVLRDMKVLENEFGCPLAFDRARNGYYLKHHGWDFIAPALLDENEMLAAVIGARIAEEIFPAPLKNKIRNAVDYLLQHNNLDFHCDYYLEYLLRDYLLWHNSYHLFLQPYLCISLQTSDNHSRFLYSFAFYCRSS